MINSAAVLWTGGKDSALAFYEGLKAGYKITHLITFVPKNPKFIAHPIALMKQQAERIGVPHRMIEITAPMKKSYQKAIAYLKNELGINTLITGDIAEVDDHPNWIRACAKYSKMNVYTPLWGLNRNEIIARLLALKFEVIFTLVKKPWFTQEWAGKKLTENSWKELKRKNSATGLDICGENGEFHTMVLNAPYFKKSIHLKCSSAEENETMSYLKWGK